MVASWFRKWLTKHGTSVEGADGASVMEIDSDQSLLQLAKEYFTDGDLQESEQRQDSLEKGVGCLIKASRKGNEEATALLSDCLKENRGISESNLAEVSWCVQTPRLEKLARQAATQLFHKLNPMKGANVICKADYLKGLDSVTSSKSEKKLLEKAAKFKDSDELTEDVFVEKLMKRLNGYGGGISLDGLLQSDVEMEAYNNASVFQKLFRYPGKSLTLFMDKSVESASRQGMVWLRSMIPTNQIYMLFAFFMYSLISVQLVLWFLPLFAFYISFAAMVICTMQMFYSKRKVRDVKAVANMLQKFNTMLDTATAESSYEWNKLTPYLSYFIALCGMTLSFAMADKGWIPCSEFMAIGMFFTVTSFMALSNKYDHLALLSILVDFFSTLPYFIEDFPNIPVVSHILTLFCGSIFSMEIVPGMHINIGLPSLAYMIVPILFIRMATQNSWTGTYRVLIPHLVCFFWWKVSVMFFRYSSWLGLIRASVGWVLFVALLPIFFCVFVLWLLYSFITLFTIANLFRVITTIVLLTLPILFGLWAKTGFKVSSFSLNERSFLARSVLVALFVLSVVPMLFYFTPPERDVAGKYITWEQYRQYCSHPQWEKTNMADSMIICSHFKYNMVEWQGTVKKIVVSDIFNQADAFLQYFPFVVSNWIRCTYGEAYPDCDTLQDDQEREICELSTMQSGSRCHLANMNKYTFDVWIHMPVDAETSHDVKIHASDWFKDTLLKIRQNDEVYFRASLVSNLGNIWPELRLYYVECRSCDHVEGSVAYGSKTFLSETSWNVLSVLRKGMFEMWNFFFAPVVELKVAKETNPMMIGGSEEVQP